MPLWPSKREVMKQVPAPFHCLLAPGLFINHPAATAERQEFSFFLSTPLGWCETRLLP